MAGMSIRTARVIAIGCVLTWAASFASGIGFVVSDNLRHRTASTEPKPGWTRFVEHGQTYFARPDVARWRDGFGTASPILLVTAILGSLVAYWAADESDAIGRPWGRISRPR